jgi:hypothetical protein
MRVHTAPFTIMLAAVFAEGSIWPLCQPSTVSNVQVRENAIRAAEDFVKNNKLDTRRPCPKALRVRDAQPSEYSQEELPLCQPYTASESKAYAMVSLDEYGWQMYFRKRNDPRYFRLVEVHPKGGPQGLTENQVCLSDRESGSSEGAIVLGRK